MERNQSRECAGGANEWGGSGPGNPLLFHIVSGTSKRAPPPHSTRCSPVLTSWWRWPSSRASVMWVQSRVGGGLGLPECPLLCETNQVDPSVFLNAAGPSETVQSDPWSRQCEIPFLSLDLVTPSAAEDWIEPPRKGEDLALSPALSLPSRRSGGSPL